MVDRRHGGWLGATAIIGAILLVGCAAGATPAPTPVATSTAPAQMATATPPATPPATPGPTPPPAATPTPDPTPAPTPDPTPAPTATPAPTPSLPAALVLSPKGLGDAKLGDEPAAVIEAISAVLGRPSLDGDWEPSFSTYGTCPGTEIRPVGWGPLLLLFTDGPSAFAKTARPHLFEIRYADQYAGEVHTSLPIPVTTQLGITLGSTKADIKAAYGKNVAFDPENVAYPPAFHVGALGPGGVYGFLDETNDAARVTELGAGQPCGY